MADRRYLAQEITDSGQVEQLVRALGGRDGFWAATFFSWLIPFIDDDGRMIGSPETLRAKVLGRYQDLVTTAEVAEVIALMNDTELLVWYEVVGSPGERYLYSPRFTRHQTLRADRYGPSRHPAPPGWTPDQDHPYGKNPTLRAAKPPRDPRRTVRVAKRPLTVRVPAAPLPPLPPLELADDRDDPHGRIREAVPAPARPVRGERLGSGGRAPVGEAPAPATHEPEPMDTGKNGHSATTAQPQGNPPEATGNEASHRVTPRHVTSHRVTSPLTDAVGVAVRAGARSAIAEDAKDGGSRLEALVAGGGIGREDVKAAILTEYQDLATRKDEELVDALGVRFTPGMYGDGRVRDRRGRIHASSAAFLDVVREEAEIRTDEVMAHAPVASDPEPETITEPPITYEDESGGDQ